MEYSCLFGGKFISKHGSFGCHVPWLSGQMECENHLKMIFSENRHRIKIFQKIHPFNAQRSSTEANSLTSKPLARILRMFFFGGVGLLLFACPKKRLTYWENGRTYLSLGSSQKIVWSTLGETIPEIAKKSFETTKQAFWDGFPKMRWEPAQKWGDIWCHPRMRV